MYSTAWEELAARLSPITFGCGDNARLMVGDDEKLQEAVVGTAIEGGITTFDTAAKYGGGRSEIALGRVLKRLGQPDVTVASKISIQDLEPGDDRVRQIRRECEASLRRLDRDHIDLYQVHNRFADPGREIHMDGGLPAISLADLMGPDGIGEALVKLRDDGLVGALGLTSFGGDTDTVRPVLATDIFDALNASYHMLNPSTAAAPPAQWTARNYAGLGAHARSLGMGLLAIRPLAGGWLAHESPDGTSPPEGARHPDADVYWDPGVPSMLSEMMSAVECDLPALGQSFSLASESVSSVVSGFSSVEHVRAALTTLAQPKLSRSDVEAWTTRLYEHVTTRA